MEWMTTLYESIVMYPFIRYALIAGVLISLCSSLLGVTLVLKRYSFIGDGLSHVAFCGSSVAGILLKVSVAVPGNASEYVALSATGFVKWLGKDSFILLVSLVITVLCAMLILCAGPNAKIKGDAAVAMISVGSLALGYLLINLFGKSANLSADVCSTLFGAVSILTLTFKDVLLCVILSVVVIAAFILFYNKIFCTTFDESFSKATGMPTKLYNRAFSILIAIVIVLAMKLVGSLLISALIIFPVLSAMRVFKSFRGVTVCSAVLSVGGSLVGIVVAFLKDTPVGSTIVAIDLGIFLVFYLLGAVLYSGKPGFARHNETPETTQGGK